MLKRERERVSGNTKPSSRESDTSDRRNRASVNTRNASRENSSNHEVTAEQRVHTLEVGPVVKPCKEILGSLLLNIRLI